MPSTFWQLSVSSQHMVKSLMLNPYISLFNLKICTHIWSTNINFRPHYNRLFGPSWSELSPYGWIVGGDSIGPPTFFVTDGLKRNYLSRASQHARDATKNSSIFTPIQINHCCLQGHASRLWNFSSQQRVLYIKWLHKCVFQYSNNQLEMTHKYLKYLKAISKSEVNNSWYHTDRFTCSWTRLYVHSMFTWLR